MVYATTSYNRSVYAESKEMTWRDGDTTYYPGGVTDPDYCVLKFTAHKGRYYSNFSSEDFAAQEQTD